MLRALGSDEPVEIVLGEMCCDVSSQGCSREDSAPSDLDSLDMCTCIP